MNLPYTLHLGDCREILKTLPDNSVDSIVTDPPYELGFMGRGWDRTGIANDVGMWTECLRVIKPGGHLLAFSGTRTYHRMVVAIEDAGFEIRDQIGWLYGSGFPKSRNIAEHDLEGEDAKRWAGWGTALKPAWEPICVARKPLEGTVAANVLAYGTGALNIEACRVAVHDAEYARNCSGDRGHDGTRSAGQEGVTNLHAGGGSAASGRWPANVIHDGSDEVVAAFPQAKGQQGMVGPQHGAKVSVNTYGDYGPRDTFQPRGDTGSAARFFYCAKASKRDRDEGLEGFDKRVVNVTEGHGRGAINTSKGGDGLRENRPRANIHPTVKPTDLMAFLCRLVTPPGGVVLDPFMGSGSTGKACMREGFRFIGIDLTPEYVNIARARIAHELAKQTPDPAEPPAPQMDLFSAAAE